MEELMLKIDNVSKRYRLGQIGGTTLRDEIKRKTAKMLGKEDPTKKIGAKDYKSGETFMALDGISFEVKKGEVVGIIGHNGAGKSTLLKLISRVTAPTSGTISLNGRIASMLEVGTGFHPELTGRENIYMNGAILGMTKREIDAKMDDIIEFSECGKFIDTPVKRYSSGMYVKLAFSVAAHLDSEIMVMDEVLAVGDMKFQEKCLGRMEDSSNSEGKTILYVSHNMNTIRQLCTRCIVLDHGKLIFDGNVKEAIDIYIGKSGELDVSYNYDKTPRNINDSKKILYKSLLLEGKSESSFICGEPIKTDIKLMANKDVKNARIRLEFHSEANTIVGAMFSSKSFSVTAGNTYNISAIIPTKNFSPGKYRVVGIVEEFNEFGAQAVCDRVEPLMMFEVENNNKDLI